MRPKEVLPVRATADAMATETLAGFGGAVFFANGSCAWFQIRIEIAEAQALWQWVGPSMQKHIAAWEMLAQFALTFCIEARLPPGHSPVLCHQGTDNSAADASAAKGLTRPQAWLIYYARTFCSCDVSTCIHSYRTSLDTCTNWLMR